MTRPAATSPRDTRFESVLYDRPATSDAGGDPEYFADLNLDQVVAALVAGREHFDLGPLYASTLTDVDAVHYRHDVMRDLEKRRVRQAIEQFADAMRRVRRHLAQVDELRYRLQKEAWFLDAVEVYCDGVRALEADLAECGPDSKGLRALRDYLAGYARSQRFVALADETHDLKAAVAAVRYAVQIGGGRVTVTEYEGEPDYGAEVEETFAKFQQGAVKSYLARLPDDAHMDHVEAQILDGVARLNPEVFTARAEFCARHADFVDATIQRFDREAQFYLAYLELVDRLRAAGLPFCYPRVSERSKATAVDDAFDLALAVKLVSGGGTVVCNDLRLDGPERVFVVSGPNNGGKTTFARAFGQLHHLAGLGLPVPGRQARLFLPDRIFTHFEREEDVATLRGKFDDELVRVHEILELARSCCVIVLNESFSSTSLSDALFVGSEVMGRILELDCLGVYVTFVDELASLSDGTVSMVSQIAPGDPTARTFKVIRARADGRAYAWAIADKYGLSYDRLMERIAG